MNVNETKEDDVPFYKNVNECCSANEVINIANLYDTYKIRIIDYLSGSVGNFRDSLNAFLSPSIIGY